MRFANAQTRPMKQGGLKTALYIRTQGGLKTAVYITLPFIAGAC